MTYLFDLDGTLIDSERAHKVTEVATFHELGIELTEEELFRFTGVPYRTMVGEVAPHVGVEAFLRIHKERLLSRVGGDISLFPDVLDCLQRLSEDKLCLVTSSPAWYLNRVFEVYPDLGHAFAATVCGDDVTRGKPDPEAFLLGAERTGDNPLDCVAIEDSPNGIASATAAGCYTVAVARDTRLDLSGADLVIGSLAALPLPELAT